MGEIFDKIQNELIGKIGIENAEYLLQCMSMNPTNFIISFRSNIKQGLIKKNICPECHSDLVDKVCPKCKILWEEN